MLRTVRVTRYVTPLREGGSLPAIVEGSDDGLYVIKFRGAGQGPLALVAELIGGEIGRALDLRVPELVFLELDERIGRNEPDPEIRELLLASAGGLNLGLDYLPGSVMFDPAARDVVDARTASAAVWFDSLITNVDRTARNANLLWWHKRLYFIDHGASLYFHHNWGDIDSAAVNPFPAIKEHVLLPWATEIAAVDTILRTRLTSDVLTRIVDAVPAEWLQRFDGPSRSGYLEFFSKRLKHGGFVEEAIRAHARLV